MFTIKEVYDIVVDHVKAGGKRSTAKASWSSYSACQYRGDNGARCFVGLLIPDEDYHPSWENGYDAFDLVRNGMLKGSREYGRALADLQEIHDSPLSWNEEGVFDNYVALDKWLEANKDVQTE